MNSELRTKLDQKCRVVIPAAFRQALGVEPGGEVLLRLESGELRITTQQARIRRAQLRAGEYVKGGASVVDEFLQYRRRTPRIARGRSSMPVCESK
jgi:AbrB family looped-hinge helix DNA binding protein